MTACAPVRFSGEVRFGTGWALVAEAGAGCVVAKIAP